MREPKKMKSSPTIGAATVAENSPLNRQPKTPKQGADTPAPDTPGSRSEPMIQWSPQPLSSQARAIKAETQDMPPPTPDQSPLPQRSPAHSISNIPASPLLEQLKKEDPMEKLTQMTSQIGQPGLMNLRSPSAAPSTPSYVALSPRGQGAGAMSPHLAGGGMVGPQGPIHHHGMPPADQPYLPSQNCIYVFDTDLANEAAAAVEQKLVYSIIDFHLRTEKTQNSLARLPEGRANPWKQQQQQMHQRPQMMPQMHFMHNHQQQRLPPPQQHPSQQMRPDFNPNHQPMPTPHQTKQMKMNHLRMMKEACQQPNQQPNQPPPQSSNGPPPQVAPPPPYGPPPPNMMPSRPPRPTGGAASRGNKRSLQMETTSTITLEEVNFQAQQQQQQMEMMAKNDPGVTSMMPVPSPQPIQYISSQLDQEVVIQKQPNRNFIRGPVNGAAGPPRAMAPRMRPGMMMEQDPMGQGQFVDHISGQRPMMMPGPGNPNMGPVMTAQMHQQSQYQAQLFSNPQTGQYPQSSLNHQQTGPPGTACHGNPPGPCSPNQQLYHAQQLEASMRSQFQPAPQSGNAAQTVNNTYVNANIAIEHVNIQNVPGGGYDQSGPPGGYGGFDQGQNTFSDPSLGQPGQQMHIRPTGSNTIQYYSNRPPPPPRQPRQPVNLDFLPLPYQTGPRMAPGGGFQQPNPQGGGFGEQGGFQGEPGFPAGYQQFQQQLYASNGPAVPRGPAGPQGAGQ